MSEGPQEDILRTLEPVFGERLRRGAAPAQQLGTGNALASVLPVNAEEVQFLAEVAGRLSVPLVALGGETVPEDAAEKNSILIHFDLMRRTQLPTGEEAWVEAEAGVSWLQLEDELHLLGRGLTVYPTSAPRATIGGWVALDGLGVGSFEYGWLRENMLSVTMVLPGGELAEVSGDHFRSFNRPETAGIIVGARLSTRRADADVPFGAGFRSADAVADAVADVVKAGLPLWHLAFLSPGMARARNLGDDFLLFGAYPAVRREEVEDGLGGVVAAHRGDALTTAEAHRIWGERFFPVRPSILPPRFPHLTRKVVSLAELPEKLRGLAARPGNPAVQGAVARSREVSLLTLEDREPGLT